MPLSIDLSRVPPPDVVQALSLDALVAAWRSRAESDVPEIAALDSEADPAAKWMRTGAYREGLVRGRVNDAARAVMLATAEGADLDNLAALFGITRETLVEADPDADPPVEEVLESDERLRRRVQLFPGSISTAGPESAYRFHVLAASPLVKDVAIASPVPGSVTVTVLREIVDAGDTGIAPQSLLDAVEAALGEETVRPMGDVLTVESAGIVDYVITAALTVGTGPDSATVLEAAEEAIEAAALAAHRLGGGSPRSALIAALHVPGVDSVDLTSPAADVAASTIQAAHASTITVTVA